MITIILDDESYRIRRKRPLPGDSEREREARERRERGEREARESGGSLRKGERVVSVVCASDQRAKQGPRQAVCVNTRKRKWKWNRRKANEGKRSKVALRFKAIKKT